MTAWNVSDAIKIDVSGPENGIYLLDTTGVGSVRIKAADDGHLRFLLQPMIHGYSRM